MATSKNDKDQQEDRDHSGGSEGRGGMDINVGLVRTRVAQVVWVVCALFALVLALGALTYALKANPDNGLVEFCREWADRLDLGVFSLTNGIKEFGGDNAEIKNALVNWGLGAVFWLVVGKALDKVIRP